MRSIDKLVAEMARTASVSPLGSEFNDFLFAPIGDDRNGMLLSVLSALARLDVDPWQEAATLSQLPGKTATERLASLIAALPERPSSHLDSGTIAARLIALLPRRAGPRMQMRETLPSVGTVTNSHAATQLILYAIFMAFLLGVQCVIVSRQPPAHINSAQAPASGAVSPKMPPPTSGQ